MAALFVFLVRGILGSRVWLTPPWPSKAMPNSPLRYVRHFLIYGLQKLL